ncbi:MAG: hypothetical protein OXG64_03865 [Chloroflexi bacterium]|nr:hypothetical protein [Chloroflexota bacterium]
MTVDPTVLPGLMLLAAELGALTAVGFVVARVALGQADDRVALAQGLVVGPAVWGLAVSLILRLLPGMAGAIAGWTIVLAIGAGLAWRAPHRVRPSPRTVAGFTAAAFLIFWVGLASRQLLVILDWPNHLGLAASLRAGGFPPTLSWHPGWPVPYHYGFDLLVGLLTPPFGPDFAFVTELLSTYVWMSLTLAIIATLLGRGGWVSALALAGLVLSHGAWTRIGFVEAPALIQVPVLTGLPAAGVRASLTSIYWPSTGLPWATVHDTVPPNIWSPSFALAYALAFVALERAAAGAEREWLGRGALAALIGFLGLVAAEVAVVVLALWGALGAVHLVQTRSSGSGFYRRALRLAAGPALAALLLAVGGGALTGMLTGSSGGSLSLGWTDDPGSLRPLGSLDVLPGGVGVLGLGVIPVGIATALLGWRDRLTWALLGGAAVLVLAALTLHYKPAPYDLARLEGHARNFALLALLLALSARLPHLAAQHRYAAGALVIALIAWPTAVAPARGLSLALGHGVQLANAQPGPREFDAHYWYMGRQAIHSFRSESVAAHIRTHSEIDDAVLSPNPREMSIATGRPNASGFVGFTHLIWVPGPDYEDAIRYLEPAAIRRIGVTYVHATDDWVAGLPVRARRWLTDPRYFAPLVRHGSDALYRVRPAFLELDAPPTPMSFTALRQAIRQAVPASATVYLSPGIHWPAALRLTSALSHAQLLGVVGLGHPHVLPPIPTRPLGARAPDFVAVPARLAPSAFSPGAREPILWTEEIALFAADGSAVGAMDPPPRPFGVQLSDVRVESRRISFIATFADGAPDRWNGQDWLVVAADASPWAFPRELESDGRHAGAQWYAGQIVPGQGTTRHA